MINFRNKETKKITKKKYENVVVKCRKNRAQA